MSGISDVSTDRRLQTLYDRVADLERQIEGLSQVSAAPASPRDVWLARTVANGETYPTSGNTFFVELIRADFATSAGDTEVTEYRRGTIVAARTWPDAYVPEGSQVVVMRIRGKQGPGEWWIETHSVDLSTMWAWLAGDYGNLPPYVGEPTVTSWSVELTGDTAGPVADQTTLPRLGVTVPGTYAVEGHANVYVSGQAYVSLGQPAEVRVQNFTLSLLQNGAQVGVGEGQIATSVQPLSLTSEGRSTIRMSTVVVVPSSLPRLELWLATDGDWQRRFVTVYSWQLLATRLGD